VIARNTLGPATFTLAARVNGIQLDQPTLPTDALRETDGLYANLAKYLVAKYIYKQPYLRDIFEIRQYMFGWTAADSESHVRLVDVDPLWYGFNDELGQMRFRDSIRKIKKAILTVESNNHTCLEAARAEYPNAMWYAIREQPHHRRDSAYQELSLKTPV
jgi:hypothetical protein